MQENFERMLALANDFFEARNDPDQINVTKRVMARLMQIHPATMSERRTKKGPVAWMLVIPTTTLLMEKFVEGSISERQLLKRTPLRRPYRTIYLCSALVLPEYRKKGIAAKLLTKAIRSIRREHPIEALFYWSFSRGGSHLARSVARQLHLPLVRRKRRTH